MPDPATVVDALSDLQRPITGEALARADARRARVLAMEMLRTRLGVRSWARFARECAIPRNRIYRLITGDPPKADEIECIAAAIVRRDEDGGSNSGLPSK